MWLLLLSAIGSNLRTKDALYRAKYDLSLVLLIRDFYLEIVADGTADGQRMAFLVAKQVQPQITPSVSDSFRRKQISGFEVLLTTWPLRPGNRGRRSG